MQVRDTFGSLIAVGFLATAASFLPGPVRAQDPCIVNQYRLCVGDCPQGSTDQGECTTRLDPNTNARWCCCPDSYNPNESGVSTTPAPPSDQDTQCSAVNIVDDDAPPPPDDDEKPEESGFWAASAAVKLTAQPKLTDQTLTQVRTNVLERNARTARYVPLVNRLADEINAIYAANPALAEQTARLMEGNLPVLSRLAGGAAVSVNRQTLQQIGALMERMAGSPAASDDLKRALRSARQDLTDTKLLRELGVTVQP